MLSAVVLVRSESDSLDKCLSSLNWCNEVLVISDNSPENTLNIAKKHKCKTLNRSLNNDFSAQRNWAQSQTANDWVLFLDADEIVPDELKTEIQNTLKKPSVSGYFIKRVDTMWNKKLLHGDVGDAKFIRLAKKDKATWVGRVHETWQVSGQTASLRSSLLHFPHQNMVDFLRHINFYSSLRANELKAQHQSSNIFQITLLPVFKFFWLWVCKLGFLDGTPGFIHAMTMSFYTFLTRSKLWLTQKNIPA